jgi:Icc-related predicted phosphoesterase
MRLVLASDTHEQEEKVVVPDGDIFIHTGDATYHGAVDRIAKFANWLRGLPHKHKVFIAGNHDFCFENRDRDVCVNLIRESGTIYLENEAIEIDGLKIYGSPCSAWYFDWAFNVRRGADIAAVWAKIPDDTQVLLTHGPAYGMLDTTKAGEKVGDKDLLGRIDQLKQLRLFACGHIHEGYGTAERNGVKFVNASSCNRHYQPINPPIVIDL